MTTLFTPIFHYNHANSSSSITFIYKCSANRYAKATVANIDGFIDFIDCSPSLALQSVEEIHNKLFDLNHKDVVFPVLPCKMYSSKKQHMVDCSTKHEYVNLLRLGYTYDGPAI